MTHQAVHPEPDKLKAFGLGQLDPQEAQEIELHITACDDCCQTLFNLHDDTFIDLVRRAEAGPMAGDATQGLVDPNGQPAPPTDVELPPSLIDHPRYRVVALLGQGGMGDVYKAEHKVMNRPVALKLINTKLIVHPQAVERFRREVQAAARLAHPHIVTAYDAEQSGNAHFLVMEFVDGVDLAEIVHRRGPLPVAEACEYIRQAAEGLQHAHEMGMVHRDIKPQNLMIVESRESRVESQKGPGSSGSRPSNPDSRPFLKILDFGLARFASEAATEAGLSDKKPAPQDLEARITAFGTMMGTPDYLAPEQSRDAQSADVRADIYALGCTLYFLLAGRPPFAEGSVLDKVKAHAEQQPQPLSALRGDLPPGLSEVVQRMMAKDAADRHQTPADVAAALIPFVEPAPRATPSRRTRRLLVAIVLAAAGLLAAVLYVQLGKTTLRFDIADPNVVIHFGEQAISFDNDGQAIRIKPGEEQKFVVEQNGVVLETDSLVLRKSQKVLLTIAVVQGRVEINTSDASVPLNRRRLPVSTAAPDLEEPDTRRLSPIVEVRRLTQHFGPIRDIVFLPDGRRALSAAGFYDAVMRMWDVETGKEIKRLDYTATQSGLPTALAISPDGKRALSGHEGGNVDLWDVETGASLYHSGGSWDDGKHSIRAVAIAPNGRLLATDISVKVFTQDERGSWDNSAASIGFWQEGIRCAAYSLDCTLVLVGCDSGRLALLDPRTSDMVRSMKGHEGAVLDVCFSSDGRQAASASTLGKIYLWDVQTGSLLHTLRGHEGPVNSVAFTPNGELLVSGGADQSLRVWDLASQRQLASAKAKSPVTNTVAVSPDGRFVLSGGGEYWSDTQRSNVAHNDRALHLWELPAGLGSNRLTPAALQRQQAAKLDLPVTAVDKLISFRLIPSGDFPMGSSTEQVRTLQPDAPWFFARFVSQRREAEMPQHRIEISRPFYLGAHEVTVGQFRQFVEDTGYVTDAERGQRGYGWRGDSWSEGPEFDWRRPGFEQTDQQPVCNVSWADAIAFCRWLDKTEGGSHRLPSEAEWEYACRAGTTTLFSTGDDVASLRGAANLADQSTHDEVPSAAWAVAWNDGFRFTAPVGNYHPNAWGLYDMHGNAWEWCQDVHDDKFYRSSPAHDPLCTAGGGTHVFRGGGFDNWPGFLRSADRYSSHSPTLRTQWAGFRVLREIPPSTSFSEK